MASIRDDPTRHPASWGAQATFGVLALLLVALVVVAYQPALRAAYVFDDEILIAQDTRCNARILHCFAIPFFPSSPFLDAPRVYYRPLVTASFVLFQTAAEHHAVNVLLHAINALLLFVFARRGGRSLVRTAALVALWAVHPRLAEAVTWVSGRTDLLATTFVLGALLAWPLEPLASGFRDVARRLAAVLLLAAGMLAKEVAVAGVVGVVAASVVILGLRRGATRAWPAGLAVVLAVGARLVALGGGATFDASVSPVSLPVRLAAPFEALARYAQMTLAFHEPWSARGVWALPSVPHVLAGVVLAPLLVWACLRVARARVPDRVLAGATGLAALLAAAQIVRVALHGAVVADRLLYIPLAGLVVVLAGAGPTPPPKREGVTAFALGLAACLFVPFVRRAASAFESDMLFLTTVAERSDPRNAGPRNALAVAVRDQGEIPLACALFARSRDALGADARRTSATFVRTSENLAACLVRMGRIEPSVAIYETLTTLLETTGGGSRERAGRVALGLGYARLAALDFGGAVEAAERARRLDPRLVPQARRLSSAATSAQSDFEVVRKLPPEQHAARATFAESVGRADEARREWRLVASDPAVEVQTRLLGMQFLAYDGQLEEAARAIEACDACPAESMYNFRGLVERLGRRRVVVSSLRPRIEALAR